ncbi:lectin C-type domain protein, partial [Ostertagia ostertagi]
MVFLQEFNHPATFDEAEALCNSEGGHLASIHSSEENDFVYVKLRPAYSDFVWIGLHQAHWPASKAWTWTDGTPFDFHIWSVGEPNDYKHAEHCAQVASFYDISVFFHKFY